MGFIIPSMDTSLEEKAAEYIELKKTIEALEARKKALAAEMLECMPKESRHVDLSKWWVKKASILSIKTSLAHAQRFGAVKIEEVIDKEKLKQLYKSGQNPPGVSEIHYIQVYTKKVQEPHE
jgi:predicted phage-related endonuclease